MPDGRGLPWLVRLAPCHVPGGRVLLIQRPGAEQGAGDDGAAREDAGGPPERGVVAVCQRQPGQGLAADEPCWCVQAPLGDLVSRGWEGATAPSVGGR